MVWEACADPTHCCSWSFRGRMRGTWCPGTLSLSPSTWTTVARKAQPRLPFHHHIPPAPISCQRQHPSRHTASSFCQGRGQRCALCPHSRCAKWQHVAPSPQTPRLQLCTWQAAKTTLPWVFSSSLLAHSRVADTAVTFSTVTLKGALCRADPAAHGQRAGCSRHMQSGNAGWWVWFASAQSKHSHCSHSRAVQSAAGINPITSNSAPWLHAFINHHLNCRPAPLKPDSHGLAVGRYLFTNTHQSHVPPCYFFQKIKLKCSLNLWI